MTAITLACKRNLLLPCPRCGDGEANVAIALGSLEEADENLFRCMSCEEDFGVSEIRTLIRKWSAVLAWLDAVPQMEDE